MAIEQTLSIIKPDAVGRNQIGEIYSRFEKNGLYIIAAKMLRLSRSQAEEFYAEHKDQPFFGDLVKFMASGPVMVQVLEGEDAVIRHRELMGATMPKNAAPGTIRRDLAYDPDNEASPNNAVHGSDSLENAQAEITQFFTAAEIYPRMR